MTAAGTEALQLGQGRYAPPPSPARCLPLVCCTGGVSRGVLSRCFCRLACRSTSSSPPSQSGCASGSSSLATEMAPCEGRKSDSGALSLDCAWLPSCDGLELEASGCFRFGCVLAGARAWAEVCALLPLRTPLVLAAALLRVW